MAETRLFDTNEETQTQRLFHYDDVTEESTIETIADVTDIVEANKALFNNVDERAPYSNEFHRVASIPMSLYFQLKEQGIVGDPKRMKAWLNDPENRFFRTRPGKV